MGIDAHVYCNCLKEGKAKPLPFKNIDIVFEEGYYYFYQDGKELSWSLVDNYIKDACEHTNMLLFNDRIGNISGLNKFYNVLNNSGIKFDTLKNLFNHGDCIQYKTVIKANQELQKLKNILPTLIGTYIIDISNNEIWHYTISDEKDFFYNTGNHFLMLYNNQFYICDKNTKEILFSSIHFKFYPNNDICSFEDISTGKVFKCAMCFSYTTNTTPKEYKVINRNASYKDCYTIDVLQRCFNASLESKNPIWYG